MRMSSQIVASLLFVLVVATVVVDTTTAFTFTSWEEYKHQNIDPTVAKTADPPHHQSENLLHGPNVSNDQRLSSDQYWEEVMLEEKSNLKSKNDPWWMGMKTSKSNWESYSKLAIDSTVKEEDHHIQDLHGPDVSKDKRDESDQFWLTQLEEEKELLHKMNNPWKDGNEKRPAITTPLDQYQQLHLDQISKQEDHHQVVQSSKMEPSVRAKSDEFWLQSFLEEKSKLHQQHDEKTTTNEGVSVGGESLYEKYGIGCAVSVHFGTSNNMARARLLTY